LARRAGLYRNPLSWIGSLIMVVGTALIIAFVAMQFSLGPPSPYLGIFAFLVFPMIVLVGALIFFGGMYLESRRRRRMGMVAVPAYPRIDLNDPRLRRQLGYLVVGGVIGAMLVVYVAYNAFLFTESNTFCGEVCHTVMEPEYVAYQSSPHARVNCVSCHIGHGVSWYVKSKISGLRQVIAVTFNTYHRPIRVPTSDLRPARGTCEECHWPEVFFGAQLRRSPHFLYDENNTPQVIALLVNTGGGAGPEGRTEGVHWHIDPDVEITYTAIDQSLQEITWMRVIRPDESSDEYSSGPTGREDETLHVRTMDCMDCHNRPSHRFGTPDQDLNEAMATGRISPELPWVKRVSFEVLVEDHPSKEEALEAIEERLFVFYEAEYPEVIIERAADLRRAIQAVQDIYETSIFPEMDVDWGTYAQHGNHKHYPGCFRCHDGRHRTADGRVLPSDCNLCHTTPQRSTPDPEAGISAGLDGELPWHVWPLEGRHAELRCDVCHLPTRMMIPDCTNCHPYPADAPHMRRVGCEGCHVAGARVQPLAECSACHPSPLGLHEIAGHAEEACTVCHPPHTWVVEGRPSCLRCHPEMDEPELLPPRLRVFHEDQTRICYECHRFDVETGPLGFPGR
jgi:hypothetical protein